MTALTEEGVLADDEHDECDHEHGEQRQSPEGETEAAVLLGEEALIGEDDGRRLACDVEGAETVVGLLGIGQGDVDVTLGTFELRWIAGEEYLSQVLQRHALLGTVEEIADSGSGEEGRTEVGGAVGPIVAGEGIAGHSIEARSLGQALDGTMIVTHGLLLVVMNEDFVLPDIIVIAIVVSRKQRHGSTEAVEATIAVGRCIVVVGQIVSPILIDAESSDKIGEMQIIRKRSLVNMTEKGFGLGIHTTKGKELSLIDEVLMYSD